MEIEGPNQHHQALSAIIIKPANIHIYNGTSVMLGSQALPHIGYESHLTAELTHSMQTPNIRDQK